MTHRTTRAGRALRPVLALLLAAACSAPRADLDVLLGDAGGARTEDAAPGDAGASNGHAGAPAEEPSALAAALADLPNPIPEADRRAAAARALVAAQPDDPAVLVDGARALFVAADLRMQRGLVGLLRVDPPKRFASLLGAGDRLPGETHAEVLALCEEGAAFAKRALELLPDDPGARTYYALDLSLVAWAQGAGRALLAGLGPRVAGAIDAALAVDDTYEAMAPLRLSARFRTQAPWPYRDRDAARGLLTRAVIAAPTPVHFLFLGDVLAIQDDAKTACEYWRQALDAEPDPSTRLAAPFHKELARIRLELFGAAAGDAGTAGERAHD